MGDMVVVDSEYEGAVKLLSSLGGTYREQLVGYQNYINVAANQAISAGNVSDNLKLFAVQTDLMKMKVETLFSDILSEVGSYVLDIDEADSNIYV